MELIFSNTKRFALTSVLLVALCTLTDCFDPLDPNGNITVTFDIYKWTVDGYMARVTIQNYYQYRHVDKPGWKLGWAWTHNEIIWSMTGALATQQGNCSAFKDQIPHSCKKDPVIVDLMPGAPAENVSENCCHDGILSALAIDPSNSNSSFEIVVGNLGANSSGYLPQNATLMAPGPGYTCSSFADYQPTLYPVIGGRRELQVFRTWKSECTYSTFAANLAPTCCVSFSSFYNPTITSCPSCSCGGSNATDKNAMSCIGENDTSLDYSILKNRVHCTDHMCPIRVHWHVKNNYKDHWRVKLTVSNYNIGNNYSNWNVLIQHPGFSVPSTTYSFNSTLLHTVGFADEVALFWGIEFYNEELLQASKKEVGSVMTEILLDKDPKSFTLSNGWAFPRRIYFNGENCEMPLPNEYPMLPNGSSQRHLTNHLSFLLIALYLGFQMLFTWY